MNIYHNIDQIVSMRSIEAIESERFRLKSEKTFFGFVTQKAGWQYRAPFMDWEPVEECQTIVKKYYYFDQNKGVYLRKPYLRLWLTNKSTYDIYFDTLEECELKRKEIINMSNSRYLEA